jgi:hypothetical protein
VHRAVNLTGQKRVFDFLGEQALAARTHQVLIKDTVPGCFDNDNFHITGVERNMCCYQTRLYILCLRERERASPGADFDLLLQP